MNVKEAIGFAKQHARDVFDKESMSDLGVEEVERDGDYWRITLGLSRPWDRTRPAFAAIIGEEKPPNRSYHVFTLSDKNGALINTKLRDR